MQAATRQKEVSLSGLDIKILGTSNSNNVEQYYSLCNIKSIESIFQPNNAEGVKDYATLMRIVIHYNDNQGSVSKLDFDIQDVTNQVGWTPNLVGLKQAAADISAWRESACGTANVTAEVQVQFNEEQRTPTLLRVSGPGSISAGSRSVSVYNAGAANGTWLGAIIKPGEQFSYSADAENDTLGAFSYDGTGTELVITTVV